VLLLKLALERVREQGVAALYAGSSVNHKLYLRVPAPWSLGGSPARHRPSGLVCSGNDGFVRGTWRPPSFVEKIFSGDGIRWSGTWREPWWRVKKSLGKDSLTGKQYS
jgi:hypothetical protein